MAKGSYGKIETMYTVDVSEKVYSSHRHHSLSILPPAGSRNRAEESSDRKAKLVTVNGARLEVKGRKFDLTNEKDVSSLMRLVTRMLAISIIIAHTFFPILNLWLN